MDKFVFFLLLRNRKFYTELSPPKPGPNAGKAHQPEKTKDGANEKRKRKKKKKKKRGMDKVVLKYL